jgi:glycosyltransferase involved in cell wall biosynthesis
MWIEEGKGGFLTHNGDYGNIAKGVIKLLKNEDIRKVLGEYNRKVIEKRNNYMKEMKKMEIFYKKLVNRNSIL